MFTSLILASSIVAATPAEPSIQHYQVSLKQQQSSNVTVELTREASADIYYHTMLDMLVRNQQDLDNFNPEQTPNDLLTVALQTAE